VMVPPQEKLFAFVNIPALLAAVVLAPPLASAVALLTAGPVRTASVSESWVVAAVLFPAVALWAFAVGALFEALRGVRRAA
jgi:hypothetical protein